MQIVLLALVLFLAACRPAQKAAEVDVPKILSHRNLGLAYLEENRPDDARREFTHLTTMLTNEPLGFANLGLTFLRTGNYNEARKHIDKAVQLAPRDPDIRLLLAECYDISGDASSAIRELKTAISHSSEHSRANYKLAQLYLRTAQPTQAESHLKKVLQTAPANLAAQLYLIQVSIQNNKPQQAAAQLEDMRQQLPAISPASEEYFRKALFLLQTGKTTEALPLAVAIHNLLKPTQDYQNSIISLVGPGGALIGFPVAHFSTKLEEKIQAAPVSARVQFVAINLKAKMSKPVLGSADLDGDHDPDLIAGDILLRNDRGEFKEAGLTFSDAESIAFADYNNDGYMDVCGTGPSGVRVWTNRKGQFVPAVLPPSARQPQKSALFADLDHDGDLDLVLFGKVLTLRNNSDESWTDVTKEWGFSNSPPDVTGGTFADFDDDGDLDLAVIHANAGVRVYSNERQGRFVEKVSSLNLPTIGSFSSVAPGDYNNDGFVDLFVSGRSCVLLRNVKGQKFQQEGNPRCEGATDSRFLDFDNDGFLDLLIAESNANKLTFWQNDGTGGFRDASDVLHGSGPAVSKFAVVDHDSDGDIDIIGIQQNGNLQLLRNDGGNVNHWVDVRLIGLGRGSGKNNRQGIGAKVELKAAGLYQMRTAQEEVTHFGLGRNRAPDVLRVVWSNGVPQNHVRPKSNQTIAEEQVLKGSCAFLYAWNGKKFEFLSDVMWKSALGMPLGIMSGGSTAYAFADSTDEYIRVPGEAIQAKNSSYTIQFTEELWETSYLDQIKLIALDHPADADVYIDEKFSAPPYPPLRFYPVRHKHSPVAAYDQYGNDLLPLIRNKDERYISNLEPGAYQGSTQPHDLILDLGKLSKSDRVVLFFNGWLFPGDASINVARSQSSGAAVMMPAVEVIDRDGKWRQAILFSFPMGKNKMAIADLSGKFLTNDFRVRLRTNMQIYWDEIFFSKNEPPLEIRKTVMKPSVADLHYRGFSKLYRKTPYSPHWFDYYSVSKDAKWRDLRGYYTRYGDVRPLVELSDDFTVIMNAGDELTLKFDVANLPVLPERFKRDFIIYCDGWIKDGDLNTAESKTVEPLPFHAMKKYPYEPEQNYPTDLRYQQYLQKYNTRRVD